MKCSTCGGKNAVVRGKVERNEKGEVFCLSCRMGKKHHGGIGEENWNEQYLGPRREGLESLIQGEWQELSIRRQCTRKK